MTTFAERIKKKWTKLRLEPIRVFCFHQVSDTFEPDTMWECDWTQTEVFKRNVLALKKKYTFISLQKAYSYIANDKFRKKRYAVLTSDDGWASLKNIVPWLAEQQIPVTFFLNPWYMKGNRYPNRPKEKFLTIEEVTDLVSRYEPFITIASHGWSHDDCSKMSFDLFKESVDKAEKFLLSMKRKVPFYAFAFGRCAGGQMELLSQSSLIPVLIDGMVNYADRSCIHRERLDGNNVIIK